MYYIYALKNKDSGYIYIGYTNDLKRRIQEHLEGRSKYTKNGNYELVYYESYKSKIDAMARERMLKKHGSGFGHLKKRISNSLS